ncbi:ABC transporter permease [Gorillibacterium sp. CAU 1737]|uniref:ABC transporter permease n=1 Tax=Gorillibacterium sp. CAU 1737 TaxID=3140362 RepID=UPI003260917D
MSAFLRIRRAEWQKLRKSTIWLLILVGPFFSALMGGLDLSLPGEERWGELLTNMAAGQGLFFLPLFTGIFAAFVCRFEHLDGGWKQLLALPVSRATVYWVKLVIVLELIVAMQVIFLGAYWLVGELRGIPGDIPWKMVLTSVGGGVLGAIPIAALQLAVSVGWTSFAGPLSLGVMLTIPNILVVNSVKIGPWYPWAQPFLAMMPRLKEADAFGALNLSLPTILVVIAGGAVLFIAAGLTYFCRKEI